MTAAGTARFSLAGLPFEVGPWHRLHAAEMAWLERLATESSGAEPARAKTFHLDIVESPPWSSDDPALFPNDRPARIEAHGSRVNISRSDFVAELDPDAACGVLHRTDPGIAALQVALKTALASRLPFEGGLPLHAAATTFGDDALVFFGPSGAGKSTLASTSPHPVFSDELVAVVHEDGGFRVRATGFWGTLDRDGAPRESHRLAALFELGKGERLDLKPLDAESALRRLLGAVLVPPVVQVWQRGLSVLNDLVGSVPAFRLDWSLDEPPWKELSLKIPASCKVLMAEEAV